MNNTQRTAMIANIMESIQNQYNAEHDLFDGEIQVNVTDIRLLNIVSFQQAIIEDLAARLARLEIFAGMTAPAPLPVDDSAPTVTFAAEDSKFEVAGWDEPTADEVTRFWSDENADERADAIREARYGKQL